MTGLRNPNKYVNIKMLHNIKARYNITDPGRYHNNDKLSSEVAIEIHKKRQVDKPQFFYGEYPDEKADDAFVVIMFPYQIDMIKKFGHGVIGTDTTHEMTEYGHYLTTLVIQDERGEGVPVAFCISKKKDTVTWTRFFKMVKEAAGTITCDYFITDGDNSYYNAWCRVMGKPRQRRLCLWHIKKNWGERMAQLRIKDENKEALDKILNELIEERIPTV